MCVTHEIVFQYNKLYFDLFFKDEVFVRKIPGMETFP